MSKVGRVVSIILMVVIIPALARHGVGVIPAALVGAGIGGLTAVVDGARQKRRIQRSGVGDADGGEPGQCTQPWQDAPSGQDRGQG